MDHDPCPICGIVDCGGVVYPRMVSEYAAGRNRDHWRRIHDGAAASVESYPPVLERAGNAAKSLGRAVASGFAAVDAAERDRRLATCRECEHFDAGPGRCRLCGCVARWKARLATEHCPIAKW